MRNKIAFIGILFLALQICSVMYSKFIPERFFCWGPYDNQSQFKISVTIDGEALSLEEISSRYHYKSHGWEQRKIDNIMYLVSQYESTYGKNDNAIVKIKYATNGKPEQVWTYTKK